jgi:AraC-like DNA-binding protein
MKRCDVHLAPEFLMFRVHFKPGALFRMLSTPLYEFGEDYFDAELVLGCEVRDVSEQLAVVRSYAEMVEVVESYLVRSMTRAAPKVLPVDCAAERLASDPVGTSLDWLARQAYLSHRQLNRKFTERIGVGRSSTAACFDFITPTCSRWHTRPSPGPPWRSRSATRTIKHMVRDFKQFTNSTPNAWLQEDRDSPENALSDSATG